MDFYYKNNLAKNDFIACLLAFKEESGWEVVMFGFPSLLFDIKTTELHVKFNNLQQKKENFSKNLNNFYLSVDSSASSLLLESFTDNKNYAISFYSSQSLEQFFWYFERLQKQR